MTKNRWGDVDVCLLSAFAGGNQTPTLSEAAVFQIEARYLTSWNPFITNPSRKSREEPSERHRKPEGTGKARKSTSVPGLQVRKEPVCQAIVSLDAEVDFSGKGV